MENTVFVKKGDIYLYDFGENIGSIQNGIRPAVVIQGDEFNKHSPTTVIAAITTSSKKSYLPSHIYLGDRFGLRKPSMVLLEQIRTVNQSDLGGYIGTIDDKIISKLIWQGLKKMTGNWNYNKNNHGNVYCLCPRCLSDVRYSDDIIVSRLDPFQSIKDICTFCNTEFGFDYLISRKTRGEKRDAK